MASFNQDSRAAPQREETPVQSKYGGISPKKPLINKDHERAYFDSADWVLGKQGANSNSTTTTAAVRPPSPSSPSCSGRRTTSFPLDGRRARQSSSANGDYSLEHHRELECAEVAPIGLYIL